MLNISRARLEVARIGSGADGSPHRGVDASRVFRRVSSVSGDPDFNTGGRFRTLISKEYAKQCVARSIQPRVDIIADKLFLADREPETTQCWSLMSDGMRCAHVHARIFVRLPKSGAWRGVLLKTKWGTSIRRPE